MPLEKKTNKPTRFELHTNIQIKSRNKQAWELTGPFFFWHSTECSHFIFSNPVHITCSTPRTISAPCFFHEFVYPEAYFPNENTLCAFEKSLTARSVARVGGLSPLSQKSSPPLAPPPWNDTLYRGLWRAAILSPGQPPMSSCEAPCRPLILKNLPGVHIWEFPACRLSGHLRGLQLSHLTIQRIWASTNFLLSGEASPVRYKLYNKVTITCFEQSLILTGNRQIWIATLQFSTLGEH